MNIILSGMPASGKTSVSKELGTLLGMAVVDTDGLIVEEHGEINGIFARLGEDGFRDLESIAVERACKMKNVVISTGGGCLLREKNVKLLKGCGKIIYLKTTLAELVSRTVGDDTRPLLKGGAEQRLKKLLCDRAPVYEGAADFIVETDGLSPCEIARKISELLK